MKVANWLFFMLCDAIIKSGQKTDKEMKEEIKERIRRRRSWRKKAGRSGDI